jgi:hypothetical protein
MLGLPPAQAVAVVAPIMVVNGLSKLWVFRASVQYRSAGLVCLTALPIAWIAAFYTGSVDARLLRIGIGLIILGVLLLRYGLRVRMHVAERGLVGWGAPIGAVGGFVGTAGPLLAVAFHGHGLAPARFVGTVALVQVAIQLVRLPTYVGTDTLPVDLLPLALLLSLVASTAVLMARWLLVRIPPLLFQRLLDAFLLLIALWLMGRAVWG